MQRSTIPTQTMGDEPESAIIPIGPTSPHVPIPDAIATVFDKFCRSAQKRRKCIKYRKNVYGVVDFSASEGYNELLKIWSIMGGMEYFMNRREAREVLLGLIYEADFAKNGEAALPDTDAIYRLAAQCREIEPDAYVETVFSDIGGHIADIDRRIFVFACTKCCTVRTFRFRFPSTRRWSWQSVTITTRRPASSTVCSTPWRSRRG